jgi:hypothetical protein
MTLVLEDGINKLPLNVGNQLANCAVSDPRRVTALTQITFLGFFCQQNLTATKESEYITCFNVFKNI